jgi:hypothetical protein
MYFGSAVERRTAPSPIWGILLCTLRQHLNRGAIGVIASMLAGAEVTFCGVGELGRGGG